MAASKPTHITRAPKDKDNPYFMYRRNTAQDESLSWAARGILAYLLSKPDDWIIVIRDLQQGCGRDKVYAILAELEKARYLTRDQIKTAGQHFGELAYHVYEEPLPEKPDTEIPDTVLPDTEIPPLTYKRESQTTDSTEKTLANAANAGSPGGDSPTSENVETPEKPEQATPPTPSPDNQTPATTEAQTPTPVAATPPPQKLTQAERTRALSLMNANQRKVIEDIDERLDALDFDDADFHKKFNALVEEKDEYFAGMIAPKPKESAPTLPTGPWYAAGLSYFVEINGVWMRHIHADKAEEMRCGLSLVSIGAYSATAYESQITSEFQNCPLCFPSGSPPTLPKADGDATNTPASQTAPAPTTEPAPKPGESSTNRASDNATPVLPVLAPAGWDWRGIGGQKHLVKSNVKEPHAALACGAQYDGLITSGGGNLDSLPPCLDCLAKAKPIKPHPRKPVDDVFDALIAGMLGKSTYDLTTLDKAAKGGIVGPWLHGRKKEKDCGGMLAYECERQSKDKDALDYAFLATEAEQFWLWYRRNDKARELKDCSKFLSYWADYRDNKPSPKDYNNGGNGTRTERHTDGAGLLAASERIAGKYKGIIHTDEGLV